MPIVKEVASNIDTYGTYPQITDLVSLRSWLYQTQNRKLYIFDEASEHLPNTRGMSNKSVGFKGIIPEISKARARMIIVGHALLKVDSTLLDETWCKGVFIKTELKSAELISNLISEPFTLNKIPPTTIPFDPYVLAPFEERPRGNVYFKDEDKQLLWRWVNGSNYKDLGLAPMQLHRKLKKFVMANLEKDLTLNKNMR
jgi:hypothetical protein